ncbi:MAG: excisionase family DNA-binding protein [Candidatus Binatia bacterium]
MLVSIREAAKALSVSDRHVRRMIAEGKFPFYRVGDRAVRLDLDEIKSASRGSSEKPSMRNGDEPGSPRRSS